LECILTPSRDLAYMEGAAPINPTCVQLLHHCYAHYRDKFIKALTADK